MWSFAYIHRDAAGAPIDNTGHSARMAIRLKLGAGIEAYLTTGSDAGGGTITLGGVNGEVVMSMTAAQASALLGNLPSWSRHWMDDAGLTGEREPADSICYAKEARMIYDTELVEGSGNVTRVLEGPVIVDREVTT